LSVIAYALAAVMIPATAVAIVPVMIAAIIIAPVVVPIVASVPLCLLAANFVGAAAVVAVPAIASIVHKSLSLAHKVIRISLRKPSSS